MSKYVSSLVYKASLTKNDCYYPLSEKKYWKIPLGVDGNPSEKYWIFSSEPSAPRKKIQYFSSGSPSPLVVFSNTFFQTMGNTPLLFEKDDPVLTSAIVSTFKEKPHKAKNEWRQRGLYNVHMFSLRWAFVFGLHGRKCQPSSRVKASLDHQEKDKLNVQWGDGSVAAYRPFGGGSERNIYFFPSTHHHIIGYIEMKKLFNLKKLVKCDKDSLKLASRTPCFPV